MSGFEIVGVILGAFPLVYEAGKDAKGFYKNVKTWWRFEREFENFIAAVDREHIAFSLNIEILLSPMDLTTDERESLLQYGPDSGFWYESRIQTELRHRVKDRYFSWFMRQLKDICDCLTELHKLLPLGKAYHLDSKSVDSEIYRLKHSFLPRKNELLAKIRDKNESIYKFLDQSSLLGTSEVPSRANSSQVKSILKIQEQSTPLLKAFQDHLNCNCGSDHPYGVAVEHVLEKDQPNLESCLKVLFINSRTQIRVEIEKSGTEDMNLPSHPQSKQEDITILRRQLSIKSQLRKIKEKSSKGIFSLAFSSIQTFGNTPNSEAQLERAGLNKSQKKLRKQSNFRQPFDTQSFPYATRTSNTSLPITPQRPQVSRVRFASQSPPVVARPKIAVPIISSLCETLSTHQVDQEMLGRFEADQSTRVLLHLDPHPQAELQSYEMETFGDFLKSTPRRDLRLRTGLILVSNVLTLGCNVLLSPHWDKREIRVFRRPGSPSCHVYLTRNWSPIDVSTVLNRAKRAEHARKSLFNVGVLLLELLFRDTLECQPFRTAYLYNGQVNEHTDLCTALQWKQRAEEEFGDLLAEAIRKCIVCAFDPEPDLASKQFLQAVWQNVARPVEDFLSAWNSDV